jgi:hypothetical protein
VPKRTDGQLLVAFAELVSAMRAAQREHLASGLYPARAVGECTALQEEVDLAAAWVLAHADELNRADKQASIR